METISFTLHDVRKDVLSDLISYLEDKARQTGFKIDHQGSAIPWYHGESRQPNDATRIVVKKNGDYQIISTQDIYCFHIEDGLVFLHTRSEKYIVDTPLSMLERDLDPSIFFRSHRNALVNTSKITRLITGKNYTYKIEFSNHLRVKLTRKRAAKLKHRLGYKV